MQKTKFSIPAYIAAAVSGSVVMALLFSTISGLNVATPGVVLILLIAIVYSLPVMLFMMPATFLGIYLANRFGWNGKLHFFMFAAAATLITTAALLPFGTEISFSFGHPEEVAVFLFSLVSLGVSGGLAGLIYRSIMNGNNPTHGTTFL